MARKNLEERNIRKITKTGSGKSYSVTLPIEYMRSFGWREHQKVVVKKQGRNLIITDWKE